MSGTEWISDCGKARLILGDCLERLRELPDCSVDSVVTDPPYGLAFMGKKWDYDVPSTEVWAECLRVLKPGGHLLAFAGTRTQHRMAVRIEDAGFEIRDMIAWVYGSGFPKSADVSKMLDKHEQKKWLDVCKAIDNTAQSAIMEAWKEHSKTASNAGLSFTKSETETGTNTRKSGSVPASVLLQANPENSDAVALVAELSLTEARLTNGVNFNSAQSPAESSITELRSLATSAANSPASPAATLDMPDSSALQSAWGWRGESMADKLKAVEALKTWLGSNPSSRQVATSALCAALTADLKLITLSQSKTFQSFDTKRQTECVSATSATITESTAESLISFTVDTLKSKAIDKAAGAERDAVPASGGLHKNANLNDDGWSKIGSDFATMWSNNPATDAARQWQGWGTALKPAMEPITVARKPLTGTVAENVQEWGTGGINIDACRVGFQGEADKAAAAAAAARRSCQDQNKNRTAYGQFNNGAASLEPYLNGLDKGRWPANVLHDGSDEVVGLFPVTGPSAGLKGKAGSVKFTGNAYNNGEVYSNSQDVFGGYSDSGSAARFFYCAKSSKADRDEGCENLPYRSAGEMVDREEGSAGIQNPRAGAGRTGGGRNGHPTVKPCALMRYLCRLVTPPGGIVLDPFMGSGSTGKGAILEGFRFIGIEREAEYLEIAKARIAHAIANYQQPEDKPSQLSLLPDQP